MTDADAGPLEPPDGPAAPAAIAQTWPALAVQLTAAPWSVDERRLVRRAFEEAEVRFAASARGSGKPFVDHLVGTASATLLGGGDATTVAAALLHAAYDQGDFGDRRPGDHPAHREAIRRAVGSETEALVLGYHRLGWSAAIATREADRVASADGPHRRVLLVRVANEVDDALDAGLVVSGKGDWVDYDERTAEAVVTIADVVGAPALAQAARRTLLGVGPPVAPELCLRRGGSRTLLPPSAGRRLAHVASDEARRWTRAARARAGALRRRYVHRH